MTAQTAQSNRPAAKLIADPSGTQVWQLTTDAASEAVYFEAQAFTGDEQYVVFRRGSGDAWHPYRCELSTGIVECLSDSVPCDGESLTVHRDGRHALWIHDQSLWRVDVRRGGSPERCFNLAGRWPGKLWPYAMTMTADGRFVALAVVDTDRNTPILGGVSEKAGHPTALIRFDLLTGEAALVLTWNEGFSHPMINPTDPDTITFVPHGSRCWNMDLPQAQRCRTMVADVATGKPRPLLTPRRFRTITHESWSPDGRRLFFFDKNGGEWLPVSVCSVNARGGDWQCHYTSYEHWLGHGVVSPDGRWFVSDCQKPNESPLLLIDLQSGKARILCWPNTSQVGGHAASAHCHPSFSPSGNHIVYTSDQTGTPQVYLLSLCGDAPSREHTATGSCVTEGTTV